MTIWIKNPLGIWTGSDVDASGGIVIDGNRIKEIVGRGKYPVTKVNEIVNARDLVVLPGLVNCHHHFFQTLTRAFPAALNKQLFNWLKNLYPVWAGLDEECVSLSTRLAIAELQLSGCSMASDHHYLFNSAIESAIDIQIDECQQLGIRAVLTRGSMSLGESQGGLPPDHIVQNDSKIIDESERLLKKVEQLGNKSILQVALAPCSPFSVTPELMRESGKIAKRYNALLHTHLGETEDENEFCLKHFRKRPVDYLEDVGWMSDNVWLGHGIHFTEDEIRRLGQAKVGISHCPSSNMILSSGFCKVLDLDHAGCPIGLGVDGSASNDSSNMMQELRQAFLLQRLQYGSEKISHDDALRWGTLGGAQLFRRNDLGCIAEGYLADIAFFKLDELRFSGAGDAIAALILCGAHRVEHLMIDGVWRVKNGLIPGLDLEKLKADHHNAALRLAQKC